MMVQACDLNTKEVGAAALEVQGHLRLSRALLAILGYIRLSSPPTFPTKSLIKYRES